MLDRISTLLEHLEDILLERVSSKDREAYKASYRTGRHWGRGDEARGKGAAGSTPETHPEFFTQGGYYRSGPGQRKVAQLSKRFKHLMSQYAHGDELGLTDEERAALDNATFARLTRKEAEIVIAILNKAASHVLQTMRQPIIARRFTAVAAEIQKALDENPPGRGRNYIYSPGGVKPGEEVDAVLDPETVRAAPADEEPPPAKPKSKRKK